MKAYNRKNTSNKNKVIKNKTVKNKAVKNKADKNTSIKNKAVTNKEVKNKAIKYRAVKRKPAKRSVGQRFVIGFFKSFLFMFFVFSIGILSYQSVMHYLHIPNELPESPAESIKEAKIITEATIDDISKNLIYSVDEKSGKLDKLLMEIFHCGNREMYYITIPLRTQFTMSDSLYKKLILVQPAIPQMIKLSNIKKYFPEETVYEYGVLLVEDLLDLKLSYYTVVPAKTYKTMFVTEKLVPGQEDGQEVERDYPREIFSKKYDKSLRTLKTAEDVSNHIEELYLSVTSNLSLDGKMNYLDSYCRTPRSNIFFEVIAGEDNNSAYRVNEDLAIEQINRMLLRSK